MRDVTSEPRVLRASCRDERIASAERVSAGAASVAGTTTEVDAEVGTVTSVLAAALRPFAGAGAEAETGAGVVAATTGADLVFLSAGIVFALTEDFTEGISNAVILRILLTCLNHNLYSELIIMKHIEYDSTDLYNIVNRMVDT
jgi:hypothetical protein